jgi:DNA-damage-inducible protein D
MNYLFLLVFHNHANITIISENYYMKKNGKISKILFVHYTLVSGGNGRDKEGTLIVFNDRSVRRIWFNDEWHYSVTDIVSILTNSKDELAYWRKLKQREPQLVTICHGLRMPAKDGKMRYTDCVNTKNAFRLIQSIPSKKAEPFKQWLAQVGKERIDEIENPELAQDRVREYYEFKGYTKEWI